MKDYSSPHANQAIMFLIVFVNLENYNKKKVIYMLIDLPWLGIFVALINIVY